MRLARQGPKRLPISARASAREMSPVMMNSDWSGRTTRW